MKKILSILLVFGMAMNVSACTKEHDAQNDEVPPHQQGNQGSDGPDRTKKEGVTRLVTYNVGVFNKYITDDYQLIADMMKEIDADAVCMNELDSCTTRTRNVFQLQRVAGLLGNWDYEFGAAMPYKGGKYGEGIATKEKAVKKFSVVLPKGEGAEPRVLVVMELPKYVIATTHLDHVSALAEFPQVELITKTLKERYGNSNKPVFLGGDMNAKPGSETIKELEKDWTTISITGFGTFPSDSPKSCIDFIMQLNNGVKCEVVGSEVMRSFKSGDVSKASDHLPVMVDVKIK